MECTGMNPMLQGLIVGKYATYAEIKTQLDIWDVLDLIELMIVTESNKKFALDNSK